MVCELLIDVLTRRSSDSYEALQGFVPFSVASLAALIRLPAMVMFAKLVIQIFRGTAAPAPARARLTRTLKWALVPLVLMTCLIARYGSWWWAADIETDQGAALNVMFELYLTGLPMLIPALCFTGLSRVRVSRSSAGMMSHFPRKCDRTVGREELFPTSDLR